MEPGSLLADAVSSPAHAAQQLAGVLDVWGLSQADAARVFGVTRQAVGAWVDRGVPAGRIGVVADLVAVTDLLVRHLRQDRIPAVVRRPFDRSGGRSLLDLASSDRAELLAQARAMFDCAAVQA